MNTYWPISTFLVLVSMWGCSGGGGSGHQELKLAPASGVVKLNGKPLENPVVTFYPEKGPSSVGVGNELGEFTVKTNGQNGVSVGKCKVTVTSGSGGVVIPPSDGNEMKQVSKSKLNQKYSSLDKTDLIIEIPEAGNKNLVLDLDE